MEIDLNGFWTGFLKGIPGDKTAALREAVIEHAYTLRLRPGDTAIDVGAHRGRHTIPMAAAVGLKGCVNAIEAAPEMQKKLRAQINRADIPRIRNIVTYHDVALSDREGTAEFFYFPTSGSGLSSLVAPEHHPEDATPVVEKVPLRRLDDLFEPETPVAFLKADIEGAEYHAFCGGKRLLSQARPMMVFEHGAQKDADRFGYARDDFFGLFDSLGYALFTVFGRPYSAETWGAPAAHDLFAVPVERMDEDREIIHLALLGSVDGLLRG